MNAQDNTKLLRTCEMTSAEKKIVSKACFNEDGSKIPRPKFYHDAIVAYAKKILEARS